MPVGERGKNKRAAWLMEWGSDDDEGPRLKKRDSRVGGRGRGQ